MRRVFSFFSGGSTVSYLIFLQPEVLHIWDSGGVLRKVRWGIVVLGQHPVQKHTDISAAKIDDKSHKVG